MKDKAISKEKIQESLLFIKQKSILSELTTNIVEKAAEISIEKNLGAIDSLIYSSAILNNAKFLTLDNDFRGLNNTIILN